jgi:hypothetical protein
VVFHVFPRCGRGGASIIAVNLAASVALIQSVAPCRRRSTAPAHQRSSRGPSAMPASVQSAIVPPYQSATNGTLSSEQWST